MAPPANEIAGVVVVAAGDSADAAWPLAGAVYRDASLRPKGLHDEMARTLAGEAPGPNAPASLRELAELRASVRGDDAPSRSVLTTLAQRAGVSVVLVVFSPPGGPVSARPFDARTGRFETWSLLPDGLAPPSSRWAAAPGELHRRYGLPNGAQSTTSKVASNRVSHKPPPSEAPKHWWSSPWLWGAVGAAALFAGAAVLLSRSGNSDDPPGSRVDIRVDR